MVEEEEKQMGGAPMVSWPAGPLPQRALARRIARACSPLVASAALETYLLTQPPHYITHGSLPAVDAVLGG
jgi:hypothetical protein